ncbi:MAG: choice-of-anchor D domain-containing protein [Myxococcales bacterium]|nr:choice-of-anchor D domain-containing protein [Myxococcales bacterium]
MGGFNTLGATRMSIRTIPATAALFLGALLTLAAPPARAALPTVVVLAASASSGPDVQKQIMKTNAFSKVDLFRVDEGTPTVAQLKAYDAAVVYSFLTFKDPKALGDNLATFLEQGGGVVLFDWEAEEIGSYQLAGRFHDTYTLMTPQKSADLSSKASSLGKLKEPGSPLLAGVTKFGCAGEPCHHLTSAPKNGGVVVAEWADGAPLVIRGLVNGHALCELNFFGPSDETGIGEWDVTTDGHLLIKNALTYVMGGSVKANVGQVQFADTQVGDTTAAMKVTYTNTGMMAATISKIAIDGANAADFSFTPGAALPKALAPGATFDVSVIFAPTVKGARVASLKTTVTGQMNLLDTPLLGTALGGAIAVFPTPVKMGGVKLGGTLSKMITIQNASAGTVTIQSIEVNVGAAEFTLTPSQVPPVTLAMGGMMTATVKFTPIGPGNKVGNLLFKLPNIADQNVPIQASAGDPKVMLGNNAVAFGGQHVGVAALPLGLTVTNAGFSDLTIKGAVLAGANAADFQLMGLNVPQGIAPAATVSYNLIFKPTAIGARAATVNLTSDDPNNGALTYAASGIGVTFSESINPTTLDFGMVKGNMISPSKTTTLANMSAAPLGVNAVTISGPQAAAFKYMGSAPAVPMQLGGNMNLPIALVFAPTAPGAATATLTIALDDPKMPSATVMLKGVGVAGKLTIAPTALNFGGVALDTDSKPQVVTLGNTGSGELAIAKVDITGANKNQFAFDVLKLPNFPALIPVGGKLPLDVLCAPTVHAAAVAQIDIVSDDPLLPMGKVTLACLGTQPEIDVTPLELKFDPLPISVMSSPKPVTITNTGDGDLVVAPSLGGSNPKEFTFDKKMPLTIKPKTKEVVMVTFAPTLVMSSSATLTLTPTAGSLMPVEVTLFGMGTSPMLSITPQTVSFGLTNVGTASVPAEITVRNGSKATLEIGSIASVNPTEFVVTEEGTERVLTPGAETHFAITYAPMNAGPAVTQVLLTLKGATKPIGMVGVSGEGLVVMPPVKSGGCSLAATPRAPIAAPAGLALLLLALTLRPRRRR